MATEQEIIEALKGVYDPEVGINIVDLGLIYRLDILEDRVELDFTLTYPGCPLTEQIRGSIASALNKLTHKKQEVNVVWDPPWSPDRMSEEARISLGYPI